MSDGYRRADPGDVAGHLRVYLVADPSISRSGDLVADVDSALLGGVTMVQLRAKLLGDRAAFELGRSLGERCTAARVPFLVNDRVDLALALGADGVHLGVHDMPLDMTRRVLGPDAIIGWSPETDEQTRTAGKEGADYLGVGPVFGTRSKSDAGAAIGLGELARRAGIAGIPVVAIGGIEVSMVPECIAHCAAGVAVISAILGADDPEAASRGLRVAADSAFASR